MKLSSTNRFAVVALFGTLALSCTTSKPQEEVDWKEMDDFHMLMAESFHPYRDSGNIQPAIQYAGEMASMADTWSKSDLPERVNNDDVKSTLKELSEETLKLSGLANSQDSIAIGESLNHVHDIFHKVQEAWYKKGSGDKHH